MDYLDEESIFYLNRQIGNPSIVSIDLTVETCERGMRHLGVVSTQQTLAWMDRSPALRSALLFLKSKLIE